MSEINPELAARLIDAARRQYAEGSDDNIEIDDDAKFSRGDDGCWVQAWVWVRDEEDEDEDVLWE